ncbi:MAG: hypothetical protein IK130_02860 [Oscillospiraceae bacterium]|nr:hypothetical protein [Oscillospiraceae bacterium]
MKGSLKSLLFAGAGLIAAAILPVSVSAYTLETHTPDEIRAWYAAHPNDEESVTYLKKPVTVNPMDPGRLSDASEQQALNTLNLCRYIAGLPADVALSEKYIEQTQAASLCEYLLDGLSHSPSCPKGMSSALYQLACEGAGNSNLSFGYSTPTDAILYGHMYDSTSDNIKTLGHRRWILNPDMAYTGFGETGNYSVSYAFDTSRAEQFTGEYVAWPPANMPYEFYKEPMAIFSDRDWYAFSVSLGSEYDKANLKNVTVDLTSKKRSKTYHFSKSNTANSYFLNVSTAGYGVPNCIIFNPGVLFDKDDQLTVKIGGITKNGTSAPISYSVSFFQLNQPSDQSAKAVLESETITVKPGAKKVSVPVTLKNNPGITSLDLCISYDSDLKLASPGGLDQIHPGSLSPIGIMTWYRGANAGISGSLSDSGLMYTKDGELFHVDFDVPADLVPGTYPMKITVNELLGENGKPIEFETVDGSIVVSDGKTTAPATTVTTTETTTTTTTTTTPVPQNAVIIADRITAVQGAEKVPFNIVLMENPGYSKISLRMDIAQPLAALNPKLVLLAGSAAPNAALTWTGGSGTVIGLTAEGSETVSEIGTLLTCELDIPEDMAPGRYEMTVQVDLFSDLAGQTVPFEIIGGWIDIEEPPRKAGDVNCDGKHSIADAVLLARITVEDASVTVRNRGMSNADCDGIAGLDVGDVVALLRFLAGTVAALI